MSSSSRPRFVLVHDAFHGPWCWDGLRANLRDVDVHTPALPSAGPSLGTFDDDVAAVRAAVDEAGGSVTVVAHSYGGVPVTEALAAPAFAGKVKRIVYLAAFVPDEGESLAGLVGEVPDWCEVHELEGFVVAQRAYETFYYDVDVYSADAAGRQLSAQAIEPATRTLTAAAWKSIPSSYILCEQDAAIPPPLQETMAGRTGEVIRLGTGHAPFLARPAELAALLRQLAG